MLFENEGPRFDAAVLRALDVWYGPDRRQLIYPDVELRVIAHMSRALRAALEVPPSLMSPDSGALVDDGPDR